VAAGTARRLRRHRNVIATLVPALRQRGVRVVLATVGTSTLPVDDRANICRTPLVRV
jgi:hypothetical protein